jgi:hypothetical protein
MRFLLRTVVQAQHSKIQIDQVALTKQRGNDQGEYAHGMSINACQTADGFRSA